MNGWRHCIDIRDKDQWSEHFCFSYEEILKAKTNECEKKIHSRFQFFIIYNDRGEFYLVQLAYFNLRIFSLHFLWCSEVSKIFSSYDDEREKFILKGVDSEFGCMHFEESESAKTDSLFGWVSDWSLNFQRYQNHDHQNHDHLSLLSFSIMQGLVTLSR